MGRALAARGMRPDLALVSPASRTRQTWELLHDAFGDVEVREDEPLYNGAAEALRAASGRPVPVDEQAWVRAAETELREALGAAEFVAALREGGELPVADALARALAMCAPHRVR